MEYNKSPPSIMLFGDTIDGDLNFQKKITRKNFLFLFRWFKNLSSLVSQNNFLTDFTLYFDEYLEIIS